MMVTLVLFPGMDGSGTLFEPLIGALGGEFAVKVVTYPPDKPLGYAEIESIASAALPSEGSLVLLGESFSGPIAISLAAAYPERVKGLILCSTFVGNPRPVFSAFKFLAGAIPIGFAPMSVISHFLLGSFSTPGLRRDLRRALTPLSPAAFRTRLLAVLSVDVTAQLAAVKAPVLYLRASQDRVVPEAAASRVLQAYPSAKLVSLKAPHCLLQTVPIEAAQAIATFVRKVGSAPEIDMHIKP
jgi:pimeloyl-ACP methyl ester carboxylesterase